MAINHTIIQGRFVRDPELRRTNTGKAVVSFTLAVDKQGKDAGASFVDFVAWDKTGEFINNYFTKGSPIVVEGRIETRQYEAKDGQKRTVTEVVVTQAHFYGKKEEKTDEYTGFVKNAPAPEYSILDGNDDALPF